MGKQKDKMYCPLDCTKQFSTRARLEAHTERGHTQSAAPLRPDVDQHPSARPQQPSLGHPSTSQVSTPRKGAAGRTKAQQGPASVPASKAVRDNSSVKEKRNRQRRRRSSVTPSGAPLRSVPAHPKAHEPTKRNTLVKTGLPSSVFDLINLCTPSPSPSPSPSPDPEAQMTADVDELDPTDIDEPGSAMMTSPSQVSEMLHEVIGDVHTARRSVSSAPAHQFSPPQPPQTPQNPTAMDRTQETISALQLPTPPATIPARKTPSWACDNSPARSTPTSPTIALCRPAATRQYQVSESDSQTDAASTGADSDEDVPLAAKRLMRSMLSRSLPTSTSSFDRFQLHALADESLGTPSHAGSPAPAQVLNAGNASIYHTPQERQPAATMEDIATQTDSEVHSAPLSSPPSLDPDLSTENTGRVLQAIARFLLDLGAIATPATTTPQEEIPETRLLTPVSLLKDDTIGRGRGQKRKRGGDRPINTGQVRKLAADLAEAMGA